MRTLQQISLEIRTDWKNLSVHAKPYLDAMSKLETMDDKYYVDTADTIVSYFLANATYWKGKKAREIKSELRTMLFVHRNK